MSAKEKKKDGHLAQGRIVTDSVHERLKPEIVHCPTCREDFPANMIRKHFVRTHASDDPCVYCGGKVFQYTRFRVNTHGEQVPINQTYHSCSVHN